jgi:hypothetical protein
MRWKQLRAAAKLLDERLLKAKVILPNPTMRLSALDRWEAATL